MNKKHIGSIFSFTVLIILITIALIPLKDSEAKSGKKTETKIVGLDYYFNHEMKKGKDGKEFQYHYIWEDTTNSGYSELVKIIKGLGAEITSINGKPTSEILAKISIYFIVDPDIPAENPHPNYIESDDIKNIVKWVGNGGILLLFANDKGNCEFKNLNQLSEKFGIHFNEDSRNRVTGKKY